MSSITTLFFIFSTLILFQYVYNQCVREGFTGCNTDTHDVDICCTDKHYQITCQQQKSGSKDYICRKGACISPGNKQINKCSNGGCCYPSYCSNGYCCNF
ncbi:hypothetical protein ACQ4LE_010227 [Meloidogyne hapla]